MPLNFTLKKSAYNTFLISIDKEKNILGIPIAYKTINTPLTLHNIAFSIEDKPNKKREAEEYEKACQLFAENKAVGSKVLMGTHCAIARDKKEIVVLITYEQLDDKKTIKIHQAAVKDGYKNQNLAKMLFLFLVNSNEAISTIQFSCYRGNNRVIMAYTIHGAQEYANSDDKTSHYWSLDTKNFIRENKHLSFPNKTK